MRRTGKLTTGLLFAALCLALSAGAGPQPSGGDFVLRDSTIDAGGGRSEGGQLAIEATIGQFDTAVLSGGGFRLDAGFWTTTGERPDLLFSDGFESGPSRRHQGDQSLKDRHD